ncbi:hypothetical protein LEP1GSC037_0346 [Leptospira interrogans str. 2006001854]|uniref:Uncharacterized protein n=1 Tax=Leptospira interrogans str. 2006001854 TaxID=1001590 RepID=M6G8Y5_LEPIR|nr:hypothetical protein LEP1GSC037_0346 [Leptospira interrogans str. 2006001854]
MDRNFLKGTVGDRINVILSAAGCNFSKLTSSFLLFLDQFSLFCTCLFS